MIRRRKYVRSASDQLKAIISTPEVWVKALSGKGADAIVQRIGSHYVVSIIAKPINLEGYISLIAIHSQEIAIVRQNIISKGAGGKADV
jgi:D-arabinose 1-dehydrogenase-like Zn-dependent alcohol dehydrogenase